MMGTLAAVAGGTGLGFLYWKFIGCSNGSCGIAANKYASMFLGALLGLMLSGDLARAQEPAKLQHIDQKTFEAKMKEKHVVILDVRTPGEFNSGYIPGAINIDIYAADFQSRVQKLDKSKTYLVYCRSGARSSNAGNFMITNGFKQVHNLKGGMMAWSGAVQR